MIAAGVAIGIMAVWAALAYAARHINDEEDTMHRYVADSYFPHGPDGVRESHELYAFVYDREEDNEVVAGPYEDTATAQAIAQRLNDGEQFNDLAFQRCPCESSLCTHGDNAEERCPRAAEGDKLGRDPVMLYLGPCCRPCAEQMREMGGAEYVMKPIGTADTYVG